MAGVRLPRLASAILLMLQRRPVKSGAIPIACLKKFQMENPMRYKTLGNTGLLVSEICLGTMTFGAGEGMWSQIAGLNQSEADRITARALDAGVNFLDTADVYSDGNSEIVTGQAMKNSGRARSDIVLATKVYNPVGNKGPNDRGASRIHVMNAVKASLKRLGTDYIDLYQIHGVDLVTPMEEMVRAFDDLTRQGYIRYFGLSNWSAWMTMKALGVADKLNMQRLVSLQSYYTIAARDLERDVVPMLQSEKVGLACSRHPAAAASESRIFARPAHPRSLLPGQMRPGTRRRRARRRDSTRR